MTYLFHFLALSLITSTFGTHYPEVIYLLDNWFLKYKVQSDVRIKVSTLINLPPNDKISMELIPANGTALVARFLVYNIDPSYANEDNYCFYEAIQLDDYKGNSLINDNSHDYCKAEMPPNQYFLGRHGTYGFMTNDVSEEVHTPDIDLLISEIIFTNDETCPGDFFYCQNNYCVKQDVTCNGYDDCGNNEDENGCEQGLSAGEIVVIVIGIIVLIALISTIGYLTYRRNKTRENYIQHH